MNQPDPARRPPPDAPPPTLWQTMLSVLASFFGVQSAKNRQRDFTHGRPIQFVIIGIIMTALFVVLLVTAVNLALRKAGI